VLKVNPYQAPAVVCAPKGGLALRALWPLGGLAAVDALVQQPVAPAYAICKRDQSACRYGVVRGAVAAVAVVVTLAAAKAIDLSQEAPGCMLGASGIG
jgi:hypothetical protein